MISSFAGQKYRILIGLIAILTVGVIVPERFLASAGEPQNVIHQLRIYEIFDANKKAFHDRFRDHAMRIMAKIRLQDSCHLGIEKRQSNRVCLPARMARRGNDERSLGKILARSGMDQDQEGDR